MESKRNLEYTVLNVLEHRLWCPAKRPQQVASLRDNGFTRHKRRSNAGKDLDALWMMPLATIKQRNDDTSVEKDLH